jgi:hypothetical protein
MIFPRRGDIIVASIWSSTMAENIERELQELVGRLPNAQIRRVLDFARSLAMTQGNGGSGQALLRYVGRIAPSELAIMEREIHEGCEVTPTEFEEIHFV